jgi:hypothetical protein
VTTTAAPNPGARLTLRSAYRNIAKDTVDPAIQHFVLRTFSDQLLVAHGAPGGGLRARPVDASGYQILLDHFAVHIELL